MRITIGTVRLVGTLVFFSVCAATLLGFFLLIANAMGTANRLHMAEVASVRQPQLGTVLDFGNSTTQERTVPEYTVPANNIHMSKTLLLLYWQAPTLANPYLTGATKDRDAGAPVLEPLASIKEDGELVPRLATEIPRPSNGGISADQTVITWTLHNNVRWSDDTPMTADDVVFTWQYCAAPATGCAERDRFTDVTAVIAVDDVTVRITFIQPQTNPYRAFVTADSPILQRAQFEDCVGTSAHLCQAENLAPIGTGPFRITEFNVNDMVSYERNPHYRNRAPFYETVIIKGGGDSATVARAVLETGEADYAWNLQMEPAILAEMAKGGKGRLQSAFAGNVERLMINQTNPDPLLGDERSVWHEDGSNVHPFLTDAALVQALSLAIDRTRIANELYGMAGRPTCNIVSSPPSLVSPNHALCPTQNMTEAKQMLDNLGWIDTNGNGIRDREGVELEVLYQTSTNSVRQKTQALIKAWWAEIGVDTTLRNIDAAVFFGGDPNSPDTYQKFYADVEMYTSGSAWVDPEPYLGDWRCSEIPKPPSFIPGDNIPRWCNPQYDERYATLTSTFDPGTRRTLIIELNDLLLENGAMIPLIHRGTVSAHANHLAGVRMTGWDSELWNIGQWVHLEPTDFVYLPFISR